tara:strand:+ start:459 stop:830 length:372 start_codon:yes stop_codon:yes gene_type:complete
MKSNIDKVYSKLPNKKHNFRKQRVDLSLIDDIKKQGEYISELIGIAKEDKKDLETAIRKIMVVKDNYDSTIALTDELDALYNEFDAKAEDLGIEIPDDVYSIGRNSKELKDLQEELIKLIDNI